MRLTLPLALTACLFISAAVQAQTASPHQTLSFQDQTWRVEAEHAAPAEFLGRPALHWRDGILWLTGAPFDTGEIAFELAISGQPGHTGVIWRAQDSGDWEKFYFRHHLSNQPDSVQYTPVHDGVTAWQIYSDPDAISRVPHALHQWMTVRMVVADDSADIFMNDALIHHIPDLQRDRRAGAIGFWQLVPNGQASAYVRNVQVRALPAPEIQGVSSRPEAALPEGLITRWRVSAPFDESALDPLDGTALMASETTWTELETAYNGIANLAKAARHSQGDTVFAQTRLMADTDTTALVRFGYSDRVQVFLNGARIFIGDNGWRSRDYRYLGTITRHVGVPLHLREGENTLSFAVSETFGGWGVTAQIEPMTGVRILP